MLRKSNFPYILVLAVITVTAFLPIFRNGFIDLDDPLYITGNEIIRGVSADHLSAMFMTDIFSPKYKPLVYLSWAIEYELAGLNPVMMHATNLLIHVVNGILIFYIALYLISFFGLSTSRSRAFSLIIALLFSIHPLRVESVAWAVERKDVLYALFFLLTMQQYVKYLILHEKKHLSYSALFFAIGILAKPMIITAPAMLFVLDYMVGRKLSFRLISEKWLFCLFATAGLFLFGMLLKPDLQVATSISGVIYQENSLSSDLQLLAPHSLYKLLCIGVHKLFILAGQVVWPSGLSLLYPLPTYITSNSFTTLNYIFPALLAAVMALLLYSRNRILIGLASLYIISMAPLFTYIGNPTSFMSDRFTYISSIFLTIAVGLLISTAFQYMRIRQRAILIPAFAAVFVLSFNTYALSRNWRSSETLWDYVIRQYPDMPRALNNRALISLSQGSSEKAMRELNNCIASDSNFYVCYLNRGNIYLSGKLYEQAIQDYNKVLELMPRHPDAFSNRGIAAAALGDYHQALRDLTMACRLGPENKGIQFNRGLVLYQLKRYRACIRQMTSVIRHDPDHAAALYYLGASKVNLLDMSGCRNIDRANKLGYQNVDLHMSQFCMTAP